MYLLSENETPAGCHQCTPGAGLRAEGVESNPATVPQDWLGDARKEAEELGGEGPTEGWIQMFEPRPGAECDFDEGSEIVILWGWQNAEALDALLQTMAEHECFEGDDRESCFFGFAPCEAEPDALREDRFVLVDMEHETNDIMARLWSKNPQMQALCSR